MVDCVITYQHNGCPSRAGGSSFWEHSQDVRTEEPPEILAIFDRGGFLDGLQTMQSGLYFLENCLFNWGGIRRCECTYIPSPLVWSGLKAFDDVVNIVTRKVRPQDVITYHKRGALPVKPAAKVLTH